MATKKHPDPTPTPDSTLDPTPDSNPNRAEPSKLRDFAQSRGQEFAGCSDAGGCSDAAAGEPVDTSCRTNPLVPAFSICLLRKRSCRYAMSFGHQYLCRHPDHTNFLVPSPKHKK